MRFLSRVELQSFFLEHNLVPGELENHYINNSMQFARILFDAREESELLGKFLRQVLINLGKRSYLFLPETWDQLCDEYYDFMSEESKALIEDA